MKKAILNVVLVLIIAVSAINCANRGNPEGGPKDVTPPKVIKTEPENYSTQFNGREIKIYFDEYIKLENLQKQLVISPPLKTQPEITPLGSASKEITIKIYDTLQPNTTYAFNFGNSIVDNNEGNPYPFYRYVFSTGDYIDSLKVSGQVVDALRRQPQSFISVMLYEADSTFNDSIVYREPPRYITNTLDSLTTFTLENLKAGKYFLMALKDENNDNKFQQKTDQIAFHKGFITIPTDSSYTLKLFYENIDFDAARPRLLSGEKIAFGYEGDYKGMNIQINSDVPEEFISRVTKDPEKDTLNYWYKPRLDVDSLLFTVTHPPKFKKDFTVRISKQKRDTLVIKGSKGGLKLNEPFTLVGTTPFDSLDVSKVHIMDKDSTTIVFRSELDTLQNHLNFYFDKTEDNGYFINILPEAITDFFGDKNDSLNFKIGTRKSSDLGSIRFNLVNPPLPLIMQLTDKNGEVKEERYVENSNQVDFLNVAPGLYYIRAIEDVNGNGKYDTGNYLKKIEPEPVIHFQDIEVRADWGYPTTLNFISK